MKKLVFFIIAILIVILFIPNLLNNSSEGSALEVIPDEAIRLRILANSDDDKDQAIKEIVRDEVSEAISRWVAEIDDIEVARDEIASRTDEIEIIVQDVLKREGVETTFTVGYDDSVQFPAKVYGSFVYPAGDYEAVLISLGKGEGANWWCVLFPPLCFLDFSNGATVEEPEKVEVKFFLLEWLGL